MMQQEMSGIFRPRAQAQNPRDFCVRLSQRIVDALIFGAVGNDRWLFMVLIIPRFGRVHFHPPSTTCQIPEAASGTSRTELAKSRQPRSARRIR